MIQQSLWLNEETLKRSQIRPLHESEAIYSVLSGLQIGQYVPLQVYIRDYRDGTIPAWEVAEREEAGHMVVLTVIDRSEESEYWPAHDVLTLPTKTLAGPMYGWQPGCVHARNMLGDIRQHARQIVDRQFKKKAKKL